MKYKVLENFRRFVKGDTYVSGNDKAMEPLVQLGILEEEDKEVSLEFLMHTAYWVENKERPPEWTEFQEMAEIAKEYFKEHPKEIGCIKYNRVEHVKKLVDRELISCDVGDAFSYSIINQIKGYSINKFCGKVIGTEECEKYLKMYGYIRKDKALDEIDSVAKINGVFEGWTHKATRKALENL